MNPHVGPAPERKRMRIFLLLCVILRFAWGHKSWHQNLSGFAWAKTKEVRKEKQKRGRLYRKAAAVGAMAPVRAA